MRRRGEVCWTDFGQPRGSSPAYCRPAVVVSSDRFNASRLRTVTLAVVTSNLLLADAPGNVLVEAGTAGLDRDSVVNVSALYTFDEDSVDAAVGRLDLAQQRAVDRGLRLALGL